MPDEEFVAEAQLYSDLGVERPVYFWLGTFTTAQERNDPNGQKLMRFLKIQEEVMRTAWVSDNQFHNVERRATGAT